MPVSSCTIAVMCYNEIENIEPFVTHLNDVVKPLLADYEILIIDDGSTDGAGQKCDDLAGRFEAVRVLHHPENLGIGATLKDAYTNGTKDFLTILPADFEFDPADLQAGFEKAAEGIIINYTLLKMPPLRRRLVSEMQKMLNLLLFGLKVKRTNWVKIIPAGDLRSMDFYSKTPIIETEVLVRLQKAGYTIVEIPSHNKLNMERAGGMNKSSYLKAVFNSLKETFTLWKKIKKRK